MRRLAVRPVSRIGSLLPGSRPARPYASQAGVLSAAILHQADDARCRSPYRAHLRTRNPSGRSGRSIGLARWDEQVAHCARRNASGAGSVPTGDDHQCHRQRSAPCPASERPWPASCRRRQRNSPAPARPAGRWLPPPQSAILHPAPRPSPWNRPEYSQETLRARSDRAPEYETH